MKALFNQSKKIQALVIGILLVACSPEENQVVDSAIEPIDSLVVGAPNPPGDTSTENSINIYFGFLDGDGSSNTYIDMPIESSPTDLIVGRWVITKIGVDESNNGNIQFYNYLDFDHKDCGIAFLQFNQNGIVFENSYYNVEGNCTLYSEIDEWELIEPNRFQIWVYNNIYLLNVNETELVLKYDWIFENSLWAPMQVYYYYERIKEAN